MFYIKILAEADVVKVSVVQVTCDVLVSVSVVRTCETKAIRLPPGDFFGLAKPSTLPGSKSTSFRVHISEEKSKDSSP